MSFFIPGDTTFTSDDEFIVQEGEVSLMSVLIAWGDELIEQLQHSLSVEKLSDSELRKSIRYAVVQKGDNLSFKLFFPDYGTYIDEGVRGKGGKRKSGRKKGSSWKIKTPDSRFKFTNKKPPINALRNWANEKGINKWALQEVIYRSGIRKKEWFTNVINQNPFEKLETQIAVQAAKQIELDIVKVFSKGSENI